MKYGKNGLNLNLPDDTGIAHKDTITEFHTAKFIEHPKAMNCVLDGNPLHIYGSMRRSTFLINTKL